MNALALNLPPDFVKVICGSAEQDGRWIVRNATNHAKEKVAQLRTDFRSPGENDDEESVYRIPLKEHHQNAVCYFRHLIVEYFAGQDEVLLRHNFIRQLCIWVKDAGSETPEDRTLWHEFTLRVEWKTSSSPMLWINYKGERQLATAPATEYEKQMKHIRYVAFENRIYHIDHLPQSSGIRTDNIYPVLHHSITGEKPNGNQSASKGRYKKHKKYIQGLIDKFLDTPAFRAAVPQLKTSAKLKKPEEFRLYTIPEAEKALRFGREKVEKRYGLTHYPLKYHGAFRTPPKLRVRILHVGQQRHADIERKQLSDKWLPELRDLTGISARMCEESISFQSETTAVDELGAQLKALSTAGQLPDYFVYVSPFTKHDSDKQKSGLYYQINQLMETYGVPGMTIIRKNLRASDFHYFAPNLSIKTLFRVGGIPWIAHKASSDSLVIGLGAFYHQRKGKRFVGSACVFNEAEMQFFTKTIEERSLEHLADMIRKIIQDWCIQQHGYRRIVIHYYKELNRQQNRKITQVLEELETDLKVYILNISRPGSGGKLLFSGDHEDELPQNGTCLNTGEGEYYVHFNRNEPGATQSGIKGEPWPLRVKMWAPGDATIPDRHRQSLLDQLMRYARMHWASTIPGIYPLTLRIPQRLARNKACTN